MEYNFRAIEEKWQQQWKASGAYQVSNDSEKPKYYVLDMFPYPSGAGLHVGHPLGYIASDIYARYKRLKGFNVLHPMGFDSFGLPAEQYALETGQHPAETTKKNIATFKSQLDKIGFCYDWSREVQTSDPAYYKWTQWIFLQLYNSYFDPKEKKAKPIDELIKEFETKGYAHGPWSMDSFSASEWNSFSQKHQQDILMQCRLAFVAYGEVNWCEALGTVLANDEVVNGVSERGGFPVEKKKMRQWYLRITAYADRLLEGLETVEFSESMKEMQRNWIGKSQGAEITFNIQHSTSDLVVYTTRPDTIFGVDFMVIAPEHELVEKITTPEQKEAIEKYLTYVKSRSDRERMAEVKQVTGCFTGAYAINPFDGKEIPIWIAEYVLAGYGTGAIMAVPCGDQRDFAFAKHFNIPITNIIGDHYNGEEANPTKEAILQNSGFLNGLLMKDAIGVAIDKLEELGIGKRKVNYKMRDAGFSRQRYWGEPFPIVWTDGVPLPLDAAELPLELPHVDKYGPGPEGEGPLANLTEWTDLTPALSINGEGDAEIDADDEESDVNEAAFVPKYKVASPLQYELAKDNRKNHTEAEAALWEVLRNNATGEKFRRQHPINHYIVDFVCLQKSLVVEVDGGYHENQEQREYDALRTKTLNEIGFEVIRFTNEEVLKDPYALKNRIKDYLNTKKSESKLNKENKEGSKLSHPSPRSGEGQGVRRETSTMPGYAGSSWYFLRYMDPHNKETFCDRKASDYWNQVDLYIGGTEHAVGHLLYSRMWTKVLYDLGLIGFDEPFRRLVNQGMITGCSYFINVLYVHTKPMETEILGNNDKSVARKNPTKLLYSGVSPNALDPALFPTINHNGIIYYDASIVMQHRLKNIQDYIEPNSLGGYRLSKRNLEKYLSLVGEEYAGFKLEDVVFDWYLKETTGEDVLVVDMQVEKMSKSKFNTINPDELCDKYGADTFRMYEMFLGPVEASKPWDTKGIEGVHRFLRKLWRLFFDELKGKVWNEDKATDAELKVLHRTIKKIQGDTENFAFNTAVSAFMVCVNELSELKCNKKEVLGQLLILLTPYAPHISEELWSALGNAGSILDASYPVLEEKYLVEAEKEYPVSINGKMRTTINIAVDLDQPEVEKIVLANDIVQKWLEGKEPKKIIFVKNKMVNVVV